MSAFCVNVILAHVAVTLGVTGSENSPEKPYDLFFLFMTGMLTQTTTIIRIVCLLYNVGENVN